LFLLVFAFLLLLIGIENLDVDNLQDETLSLQLSNILRFNDLLDCSRGQLEHRSAVHVSILNHILWLCGAQADHESSQEDH
jgi:hypothetical protein